MWRGNSLSQQRNQGQKKLMILSEKLLSVFGRCSRNYALDAMINHNPDTVDNVLLEWIIALNCWLLPKNSSSSSSTFKLVRIIPLLVGQILLPAGLATGDPSIHTPIADFFDGNFKKLPDVIPLQTYRRAKALLDPFHIELVLFSETNHAQSQSVKGIVEELVKLLGTKVTEKS